MKYLNIYESCLDVKYCMVVCGLLFDEFYCCLDQCVRPITVEIIEGLDQRFSFLHLFASE